MGGEEDQPGYKYFKWSMYGWVDKEIVAYNGILCSHKKNEILSIVTTWVDLKGIMLSKMSDRQEQIPYYLFYMWSLKIYI